MSNEISPMTISLMPSPELVELLNSAHAIIESQSTRIDDLVTLVDDLVTLIDDLVTKVEDLATANAECVARIEALEIMEELAAKAARESAAFNASMNAASHGQYIAAMHSETAKALAEIRRSLEAFRCEVPELSGVLPSGPEQQSSPDRAPDGAAC